MQLPIVTVPNPILRRRSREIKTVDKKTLEFIAKLEETLLKKKNPAGVGLSAPQVNKSWRIFCTLLPEENVANRDELAQKGKEKGMVITTYINPVTLTVSKKLTLGNEKPDARRSSLDAKRYTLDAKRDPILEGCLSIPGIYGPVYRHQSIKLKYYTLNPIGYTLSEKTEVFSDFTARVIQHELDHLDGILFTDRSLKQGLPIYEDKNGKLTEISLS